MNISGGVSIYFNLYIYFSVLLETIHTFYSGYLGPGHRGSTYKQYTLDICTQSLKLDNFISRSLLHFVQIEEAKSVLHVGYVFCLGINYFCIHSSNCINLSLLIFH